MVSERLNYRVKRELIGFLYASGSYALPAQAAVMLHIPTHGDRSITFMPIT